MHLQRSEDSNVSIGTIHSVSAQALATWLLSSLLILCVILLHLNSFRKRSPYHIKFIDDVLFTFAGLLALASMLTMPTVVTGVAARNTVQPSDVVMKSYISTTLFIVALGLSKMPLLIWLHRLELAKVYRSCTVTMGCVILAYMMATMITVILQCESWNPWDVQAGRCITMRSFWTSIIAIDITLDMILIILPVIAVTSLGTQQRSESWTSLVLFLRILLIVASLVRLVYMQQSTTSEHIPALGDLAYAIATQCQVATAAMLAFVPALPCLASLVQTVSKKNEVTVNKRWSGSSFGGDIATDYFTSVPPTPIKEPFSAKQSSMAAHTGPNYGSRHSSIASLPSRISVKSAPPRPQSPLAEERPDMSMFVQKPKVKRPPPVTLIRDIHDGGSGHDADMAVRLSRHVKLPI